MIFLDVGYFLSFAGSGQRDAFFWYGTLQRSQSSVLSGILGQGAKKLEHTNPDTDWIL